MAEVKRHPDPNSTTVVRVYQDTVVYWLREVVCRRPYRFNQRWVETPDEYFWAPYLQQVHNQQNAALKIQPNTSLGSGMWAEVTAPFVDCLLDIPQARSPWLQDTNLMPRLYYSQVMWIFTESVLTELLQRSQPGMNHHGPHAVFSSPTFATHTLDSIACSGTCRLAKIPLKFYTSSITEQS